MPQPNVVPLNAAVRGEKAKKRPPAAAEIDAPEPDGEEPDAPEGFGAVVPLGVSTRRGMTGYSFLAAAGLQETLSARDMHAAACISSLYGGTTGLPWLAKKWPHMVPSRTPDGKVIRDERGFPLLRKSGDFSARAAGDALMAACTAAGPVDRREMRLDGVWTGPDGESLALHCGDKIMCGDEAHPPGWQHGSVVYLAAAARPRPADQEATRDQVVQLMRDLGLWAFQPAQRDVGPALLMGMIANGILAAALPWRPHMLLRGPFGAGKSALMRMIAAACGGGLPTSDTSEAALRQGYDGRAVLIPVDEAEANGTHIARILDLMRGASGRLGAVTSRGGSEGEARTFRVNGCFLLAAITPVVLAPADASRITLLQLARPDGDNEQRVEDAIANAAALYPLLLRRLQNRFHVYLANRAAIRGAAVEQKATSRSADQLAALLAGWQVLMDDKAMDQQEASQLLEGFRSFYSTEGETADEDTPQLVLQHLLASRVPVGDKREEMTVSAALSRAYLDRDAPDLSDKWQKRLGALRLKMTEGRTLDEAGVWIGNNSPPLEAVFQGTPWQRFVWQAPLRDIPGAIETVSSMRFTYGGKARAVWLPLSALDLHLQASVQASQEPGA
jgi:hypothetical protein